MTAQDELPWRCARIAAIESRYWAGVDAKNDLGSMLDLISVGAMGAASNICAAILRGVTPEQFEKEIAARDHSEPEL